jgi:hypothetical protein
MSAEVSLAMETPKVPNRKRDRSVIITTQLNNCAAALSDFYFVILNTKASD